MDFETVSDKSLQEIERLADELLTVLRQAKLQDDPINEALQRLRAQTGEVRRARFDQNDREYKSY
jgi:hypothetical protein